jgi:Mce-associated membrane protein
MRLLSRSDQETETAVLEPADDVDTQLSDGDLELLDQHEGDADEDQPSVRGTKRRWRPRLATLLAGVAILVSGALLAASGYMIWYHQQADREHQRRAEFSAAASQAAVTLMSIDSATAQDNVRQIIDNSTGQFKDDIQSSAEDLVKAAQDSKATTKATVKASAVQSMDADSAVVLVGTATTVSNSAGANQQPRNWRLSLTMVKDGEQIKMSKVEFVP